MPRNLVVPLSFAAMTFLAPWATLADSRQASATCAFNAEANTVDCDYRYGPSITVKELSASVNGKPLQLEPTWLKPYPAKGQRSSTLILVDVSDPKRSATIKTRIIPALRTFLSAAPADHDYGLAEFDSSFRLLAPLAAGTGPSAAALNELHVGGASTEFYKGALLGVEALSKSSADRRILVIVSDGKDEDRAYTRDDVVKAAKKSSVSILSVGYSERAADSPYLQNLERLAAETNGLYVQGDLVETKKPLGLVEPFNKFLQGGRIVLPKGELFGRVSIELTLGTFEKETVQLSSEVDVPDTRPIASRMMTHLAENWISWLGGVIAVVLAIWLIIFAIRKHRTAKKNRIPFLILTELDGRLSSYQLTGTAATLGRGSHNDVVFKNDSVSSNHAQIHLRRDGAVYITDLLSSNGVYVNGERVTEHELRSGDVLELGEVRLNVHINQERS